MAANSTQRAFELFDDLVDLPAAIRAGRLRDLRVQDAELAEAVERLLAADTAAATVDAHEERIARWASDLFPDVAARPQSIVGTQIGAWQVLELLGEGGMGKVYLAQRQSVDYLQRTALKLSNADLTQPGMRDRFLRERAILAQLEHPNIAGLIDGGVTDAGQPYFAMAYIEGEHIDHWCNTRALAIRARIKLFLQVLDAVQYAHRNLVVHRDLKPANVLVDVDGHVKLLDFGIAKLLEENIGNEATRDTAMTPQYAAPEQLLGKPATTTTDIYQLGLLLHALLVGGHPWGITTDSSLTALIQSLDRAPNTLEHSAREATATELQQRGVNRAELLKQVSGDLSAIVTTCIAREPEHRYPSADALAHDLRCWLRGQPVSVRASSRSYRMRCFIRRHRWGIAATAAVVIALGAGLAIAVQQAQQARMQAARAEQVKNMVISVFREQDPLERTGASSRTPARIVADGIAALNAQQIADPELRGELLDDLGEIQASLGDVQGGQATLQEALRLRTRIYGDTSAEVMKTQAKLAHAALRGGDLPKAAAHAERAITLAIANNLSHAPDAARARLTLALATINSEQREQAAALAAQAVTDLSAALGSSAPETLLAMFQHAKMLTQLRQDQAAIAELQSLVATIDAAYGTDSPRLIQPLTALGGVLRQAQRLDEADATYQRAVALARRHLPTPHVVLANVLERYATLKRDLNQLDQAQALFGEAIAALPEGSHATLAQLLVNRGKLQLAQGAPDAAEADLRRGFELCKQHAGADDGITWYYASLWGTALARQGKLQQAERVQRDALARLNTILGPKAYQNALLLDELASTLMLSKRYSEAANMRRRALTITASKYDAHHPLYKTRAQALAEAEQAARAAH